MIDPMIVTGHVDEISRQMVSGWAWCPEEPELSVEIEILVNNRRLALLTASGFRRGLMDSLRGRIEAEDARARVTGNYGFEVKLDPPLSPFQEHLIEVKAVPTGTLLPAGKKILRPPPGEKPALTPILLTATGRSGTTLLMKKLLDHPQIIAADHYPYEIRLLSYYAAAFRTLISNADRENSTDPNRLFSTASQYSIGFNPYNRPALHRVIVKNSQALEDVFEQFIPATMGRVFRDIIVRYYRVVQADQGKGTARYFAEKGYLDEAARQAPRMFFGSVREIVIVRDPRDLICSSRSFWKLEATAAADAAVGNAARLLEIARTAGEDTIVIRYEDLVTAQAATMARLCRFLQLDELAGSRPEEEASLFKMHGTSAGPSASIGRWRNELTPEEIALCNDKCGEYLSHFGYEV